jgi:SAC3/GANP family
MIRKDMVLHNYRGGGRVHPIVLDVHERIARYHILFEHELCEEKNFVQQQNTEQLGQVRTIELSIHMSNKLLNHLLRKIDFHD